MMRQDRFTEQAQEVLQASQELVREARHSQWDVEHVFYALVPSSPVYVYSLVVISWMATVIASQALISGAFSLVNQAIQLGLCPRVTIVHTNAEVEGQIYVPEVNWG